ncbi:nucleolar protein 58-like [Oscarella lobularis]|uniref:nucleolar protein 58-like n=1 Tax=Oscarella lobularis TaxID=121494 RepID=UPI003313A951
MRDAIKEEIKRRKERIQLEKELAENRKKEKEEEERQKKQAKAIKDEALSKEDDEEAQCTKQPKPESLEEVHIPGEQQLKELIRLLEKIPKDKFIDQCIDFKSLQLQLPWKYKSSHFKKHIKDHLQQQLQILSKDVLEVLEQITGAFLTELTAALEKKNKKVRPGEFGYP